MKKWVLVLLVVCVVGLSGRVWGFPGTTGVLNGVEDYVTGAFPPPGLYFMNYLLFYDADCITNADGHSIDGTEATVIAEALRFIYSSKIKVLGGNLGWHTVIALVHKDIQIQNAGLGLNIDESLSGVGDIYVSPFILAWHLPNNWHITIGEDVILPTGEYDKDKVAALGPMPRAVNPNIGTHHYTFESVVAVTKIFPENGLVLDAKLMYDIHTEEPDSDIKTGDQFHVDFAATVPIVPGDEGKGALRAGINGYYFTSLEEDEYKGDDIDDSKERVFAIGPMVRYEFTPATSLTFKAQFEQNVHNRPEGEAFWVKLVHAF